MAAHRYHHFLLAAATAGFMFSTGCGGASTRRTSEAALGTATKLEMWWRPGPAANYPGVAVFRLFTEKGERTWLYDGGAIDFAMTGAEKLVTYTTDIIDRERKKGRLKLLFEQHILISGRPPSNRVSGGTIVLFFLGDGNWDHPANGPITIPESPILQGEIHPPVVIDPKKDQLAATFELGVPSKERITTEWHYGRGGGP